MIAFLKLLILFQLCVGMENKEPKNEGFPTKPPQLKVLSDIFLLTRKKCKNAFQSLLEEALQTSAYSPPSNIRPLALIAITLKRPHEEILSVLDDQSLLEEKFREAERDFLNINKIKKWKELRTGSPSNAVEEGLNDGITCTEFCFITPFENS